MTNETLNMGPTYRHRKKTCTRCTKKVIVYVTCFKCNAIYHTKCLLRVPGVQVNEEGHAVCCQNITIKCESSEESLVSQENLEEIESEEDFRGYDKDVESCLSRKEKFEEIYNCDTCYQVFIEEKQLKQHYPVCPGKKEQSVEELTIKEEEILEEKPNEQYLGNNESNYERLCKNGEVSTKSNIINHTLEKDDVPAEHVSIETEEENKEKPSLNDRKLADANVHTDQRKFTCDTCQFTTKYKRSLINHIKRKHSSEEQRYKCIACKYSTCIKPELMQHMRVHTNETPFKCNECEYATNWRNSLKKHILAKHSNVEKKYNCKYCDYSSHRNECLILHIRTHTNEKPHKCDICGYKAIRKNSLNRHMLAMHSDESEKYKCGICKYATHSKSNLTIHTRRLHWNVPNVNLQLLEGV